MSESQLKIFSGSSNPKLVNEICRQLKMDQSDVYLHSFPSGERYCQYKENIRGADVYIVQSMNSPVNDNLMELMVMIDAARRASACRITVVIPYMGYIRQDRKTKSRTPISGRMVADMLQGAGIGRVIGMDFHCAQAQGFFSIPVDHLYATPTIVDYVNGDVDVVVSPDVGGVKRAHAFAETLGSEFVFVAKKRIDDTTVETSSVSGDVAGKNVLIVDDMTESAGTLISAATACVCAGASKVRCAITHGVFSSVAYQRLKTQDVIDEFIFTDTTINDIITQDTFPFLTQLSVAPTFARAIERNHNNESISELFTIEGF